MTTRIKKGGSRVVEKGDLYRVSFRIRRIVKADVVSSFVVS